MTLRFDAGELITAMVTPMNSTGAIDYDKVEDFAKYLVERGTDAIVVAGSTGESAALDFDEKMELLSSVKRAVACYSTKVVMNAGSNSTAVAVKEAKAAEKEGADAILSVVPYYNKPTQEGLYEHFSAIADAVSIPVILYNIPSRTGINISPDTVKKLYENHKNIVGLKQSSPDMDYVSELKCYVGDDFAIYSGDDTLTLPMLALGVHGVISVASHVFGQEIKNMITSFKEGKTVEAFEIHKSLFFKMKKMFMVTNPIPIKAILQKRGLIKEYLRKPLVPMTEEQKKVLFSVVQ